jgi:hypothetical protein
MTQPRRRTTLLLAAGVALSWPLAAAAQPPLRLLALAAIEQ